MKTLEEANARCAETFGGLLGIHFTELAPGRAATRMPVRPELLAANGYLHAASIVALADTACGFGALASLPDGVTGFTTVELKTNFLAAAREGVLSCTATLVHGGRTTQVWDARVEAADGDRTVALFRCTQLLLSTR